MMASSTPTLPPGAYVYPTIIGGTDSDCTANVYLDCLDADNTGNTLVAGHVDSSASTTAWNYVWMNVLEANSSIPIMSVSISSQYSYAAIGSTSSTVFRLTQLNSPSGTQNSEINGDKLLSYTGSSISYITLKSDNITYDLYGSMKVNTGAFSYSGDELMFFKFDYTMTLKWFKRVHGIAANPSYEFLDSYLGATNLWQLVNFYSDASTQKYGVQKISKTDGSIGSEQVFANSQAANLLGCMQLNQNESLWYTAMYYGSSYALSLQSGTTSANDMKINLQTTNVFSYVNLAVQSSTGNFLIFGRTNSNQMTLININYSTGSISSQMLIYRGSNTYSAASMISVGRNGNIFLAASISSYLSVTPKSRIILFKAYDSLNISTTSCINTTAGTTYAAYSSVSISVSSTSATALYTPTSETPTAYLASQATLSFILQTQTTYPLYTLRDTASSQLCDIPLTMSQSIFTFDMNSQYNQQITFGPITISDFSGKNYSITAVSNADGSSSTASVNLDSTFQNIIVNFPNSATFNASGDVSYRLSVAYPTGTKYVFFIIRFIPISTYVRDPTNPNHGITSCQESIYPLTQGFDTPIILNTMNIDAYGNIIKSGAGQKIPYGQADGNYKGFISLNDQRGNPYWIYQFYLNSASTRASSCSSAVYYSGNIYGGCSISSELFVASLNFLHLVKLVHQTGAVVYIYKVPTDSNPTNQKLMAFQNVGGNSAMGIYSYQYGSYINFAAIQFSETTQSISYFRFYNYNNETISYLSEAIIDLTTNLFFVIKHYQSLKTVVQQGKISDGTVTSYIQLQAIDKDDILSVQSSLYATDKILVISLSQTSKKIILNAVNRTNLAPIHSLQIMFTSSYSLTTAAVTSDSSLNIYITSSGVQIFFAMFDSNYNKKYFRLWTANGGTFGMQVAGLQFYQCVSSTGCASSDIISGFSGTLQASQNQNGYLIFRGTKGDNCFDMLDIASTNTSWYPTISNLTSTDSAVSTSDIGLTLGYNTDNYPLLYMPYSYTTRSYSYSVIQTDRYTWGDTQIASYYKRYPLNKFSCDSIARVKQFQTYNGQGSIVEYKYSSTAATQTITINSTFNNCQDRPFSSVLWNSNSNDQVFSSNINLTYSPLTNTSITLNLNKNLTFNQQAFKVRYYDLTYGITPYYYGHALLVRFVYSSNLSDITGVHNLSNCPQNPFPIGLSATGSYSSTYNLNPQSIIGNETDFSMYVTGSIGPGFLLIAAENDNFDAFIMKISQTGGVVWFNQVNFQMGSSSIDIGTALAKSPGFVYATVQQSTSAITTNIISILKLTYNEGKLVWSKKLNPINLIDTNVFYLYTVRDLMTNPSNTSQIMASVIYYYGASSVQVAGNVMMYDNGTELSTIYDYQYLMSGNTSPSQSAGQVFFDQVTNNVYVTAALNITGSVNIDFMIQCLNSSTGSQIWSQVLQANFQSVSQGNYLQPVIQVNNLTNNIYVAATQTSYTIAIAQINKNGTILKKQLLSFSSYNYLNIDMATDHRNGNIIIMGSPSSSNSAQYFEITYLDQNLGYIDGAYQLHLSVSAYAMTGRMAASFYDFLYVAYTGYGLSNPYGLSQLFIQKKSLYSYETYRHECHSYNVVRQFSVITTFSTTNISIPVNMIYFNNLSLSFSPDQQIRNRMLGRLYSYFSMNGDTQHTYYVTGTNSVQTCNSFAGAAGPYMQAYSPLETQTGSYNLFVYAANQLLTCQGDTINVNYNQVFDETMNQTRNTANAPYETIGSNYIKINATTIPPQCSVRWAFVYMQAGASSYSYSAIPMYVYPNTIPQATTTTPDALCPDNDQQYPKVIGYPSGGFTSIRGSDLDQDNGNMVMCGQTQNTMLQTKDYTPISYQYSGFIALVDQNGVYMWGFTGSSVNFTQGILEGSSFFSCGFPANQTGVYGTFFTTSLLNPSILVKFDYVTGKVLYIRQIQGTFSNSFDTSFIRVDKQYNQLFFTAQRTDLQGTQYWDNYVAKIDISDNPTQLYYIYALTQYSYSGTYAMSLSFSQDYFITMMYNQLSGTSYHTLTLLRKSDGTRLSTMSFDATQQYYFYYSCFDVILDGQYAYYAYIYYSPKNLRLVKMQLPSLNVLVINGHNFLDGYLYGFVRLANDTNYIYAFSYDVSYQNKYLTKFQKSDLSIVLTQFFNDRSTATENYRSIVVFNNMLYLFYSSYGYLSNKGGIINQFSLTLTSPKTCTESIFYTPTAYITTGAYYNLGSSISMYVTYGEARLVQWQQYYFEYLNNQSYSRMYDAEVMNCFYQAPKYQDALVDQILQLPIASAKTYTFNWPQDCFSSQLTFTWSVDTYTTKPAFLTFTNTSSTSTLSMLPTASDVGTYVIRVRFDVQGKYDSYSSNTFVVEVYPQQSYGATPSVCSGQILPTVFCDNGAYNDFLTMDMDAAGLNFVMCGRTTDSTLNYNPSYFAGQIVSFTIGLALNFHISINSIASLYECYVTYGFNGYIQSAFINSLQGNYDTLVFLKHSPSGQYQKGTQLNQNGQYIDIQDYKVDLTTGYQYVSGGTSNLFNMGQYAESYILKLDQNYQYVFYRTYSLYQKLINGRNFAFTSTNIYQLIVFNWQGYYNLGIQSLAITDGTQQWIYGLMNQYNPYNGQFLLQSYISSIGIVYANSYLFALLPYSSYSPSYSGYYENFFIRVNPQTGVLLERIEYSLGTIQQYYTAMAQSVSQPNIIVVAWGMQNYNYHLVFNIASSTTTYNNQALTFYNGATNFNFYKANLLERNSAMYIFTRLSLAWSNGASTSNFLNDFRDFTNVNWDYTPCFSPQGTNAYFMSSASAPLGVNGEYVNTTTWGNISASFTTGSLTIPSKLFYRWYGNIQSIRMYPINNSSANTRQMLSNCPYYNKPSPPTLVNRVGTPVNTSYGGFSVMTNIQSLILPSFTQCSGMPMTYSLTYSNGSALSVGSLLTFDPTSLIISISATSNIYVGILTLTYKAAITSSTSYYNTSNFQIEIVKNQAPVPTMNFLTPITIYSHHNYNWTVLFASDQEGDNPIFGVTLLNYANVSINSTQTFLYVNQSDDTGIIFSVMNPPQTNTTASSKQFYLMVAVWDSFNVLTPNLYNISLTILPNNAPYMSGSLNQTLSSIYITQSFVYTIWYQNFTDTEGDQVIITCTTSTTAPDSSWISIDINATVPGNITFYGLTPRDNNYAGTYVFTCTVKDQFDGTPNVYNFTLTVMPKGQITLYNSSSVQNISILLPNRTTVILQNTSADPLGQPNFYSLYINNTLYDPSVLGTWLFWNNMTQNITATPYTNSQGGNHSMSVRFDDFISQPKYVNFTLQVVENWPLMTLVSYLPNIYAISNNWFYDDYNKDQIFKNPEGVPFMMYFRLNQNGNALPYFVSKNFSNGTIGGFTTDADVGTYTMECVGVDDSLVETVIQFLLIVKPCYFKCQTCWDSNYNTCLGCKVYYFLLNYECLDSCSDGTYPDSSVWQCLTCPSQCKTCTGSDHTSQCMTCNEGYFQLNNGCYQKCPDGYYGDLTDYTCKQCHPACSLCYGGTSKQCFNCTELFGVDAIGDNYKMGYLLSGSTCSIPKCIAGQYFKWSANLTNGIALGSCMPCNARCQQCTGPQDNQCSQCYLGAILNTDVHNCTYCEEIPGFFTNEEYECEDICGDGIIKTKPCDDGNVKSGDGCSSLCVIEYGYSCKVANQSCTQIIPPTFSIVSISSINQVFVQFSEPITIQNVSDIGPDNLIIGITGSLSSYSFTWRLISDPLNPLYPNTIITKFSFIMENFLQSMDGSEIIKVSFNDSSVIRDLHQNQLADNYFSQINANPFIYLSAAQANTASSGGSSMMYTFMSVFSFNLILKLVLNSSMQYLWGLVHALQVFNFLLYLNINFPQNVNLFVQYFQVATGNIDVLNQYIPNVANLAINQNNVNEASDNDILQPKFQADGTSPYFLISYGQKLTMWAFALLFLLPIVLIMNKMCKKVRLWENLKASFFFNAPLRGFVEQYIEFILQVIINTQFIKFKNRDQVITTMVAFAFGALSLLLPFITMTLIYHNRKRIGHKPWRMSYGMLTEECKRHSILQLYYYPIFMFQRLMIAGIIVYVYSMPLVQCLMVIACNLTMIIYLVIVKPFEEENLQATTVLDEIIIMVCVCMFILLYWQQNVMTPDQQNNLGWAIIAMILFSVIKNFTVVIYFGLIKARKSFHMLFGQEDMQQDSPHTSDEDDIININRENDQMDQFDTDELLEEIHKENKHTLRQNNLTFEPTRQNLKNNITTVDIK